MAHALRSGGFLFIIVNLGELRVDDVFLLLGRSFAASTGSALRFLLLLVHCLAELHRSLGKRVGLGLDSRSVIALEGFLQISDGVLNRRALGIADLGAMFGE